jgi:hypothetical protein
VSAAGRHQKCFLFLAEKNNTLLLPEHSKA